MSAGYLPAAVGNGGQAAVVDGAAYIGLGEAGEVGGLGDGEHERVGLALRSSGQLEELLEHGIGSKTGRGQGLAASEGGSDVGAIERGGAFLGGGFGHDDGIGGGEDAVDVGGIEDGLGLLTGAEAIGADGAEAFAMAAVEGAGADLQACTRLVPGEPGG